MKEINILWFKKDLRIFDNEALYEAIKDCDILPIYIIELRKNINNKKIVSKEKEKQYELKLDF